jgi:3-oxoacyl-[acyl-carrier-protein] synthase-3
MDVFIDNLTYALGSQTTSLEETVEAGKTLTDADGLKEAGFKLHHTCPLGQNAYDLAREAVEPIAGNLGDVGAIIYATCLTYNGNIGSWEKFEEDKDVKNLMDFPASHLQKDFKLDRAIVLGLNQQACTSMLGSIRLAGMVLVSTEGGAFKLLAAHQITNGAMAQANDDETVGTFFNYMHKMISELLEKASLTPQDMRWVVSQNTNLKAWQVLSKLVGVDYETVYHPTIKDIGHVISADNIINLKHLQESGNVEAGDKLLLTMAGFGLNWQGLILEKT